MKLEEMSNEFDLLYNNIASNQAPGIDEYEKSVFLTRAQDDILKFYLEPNLNKNHSGIDDSRRRHMDFSNLITVKSTATGWGIASGRGRDGIDPIFKGLDDNSGYLKGKTEPEVDAANNSAQYNFYKSENSGDNQVRTNGKPAGYNAYANDNGGIQTGVMHDSSIRIQLPNDIFYILNETVTVRRKIHDGRSYTKDDGSDADLLSWPIITLQVLPLHFEEYNRLLSKRFKRPNKNQAWEIITNSKLGGLNVELVVQAKDVFNEYTIRYVRKPKPIILVDLDEDGLTIQGENKASECELDESIQHDIVQRAAELAKATYEGNLEAQLALGVNSQTNIGYTAAAPAPQQQR